MPKSAPQKPPRKRAATAPPTVPTIGYAILTSLAHHPHTGYELSQLMGPPKNFIWEAQHSQVYPTLRVLTRHGYVMFTDIQQESRPDKKLYKITDRGLEALQVWARKGPTHVPVRDEFSLKMAAVRFLPPREAVAVLARQIDFVNGEIEAIELHLSDFASRFRLPDPVPSDHQQFCLLSAIRLSRDVKIVAVAAYQRLLEQLADETSRSSSALTKRAKAKAQST